MWSEIVERVKVVVRVEVSGELQKSENINEVGGVVVV
jgi:hypothetical protein